MSSFQWVDLPSDGYAVLEASMYYTLRVVCTGFPMDFFPVLFAVPRVVGWLAHWRQMMHQEGGVKIWRPRQVCRLSILCFGLSFSLIPLLGPTVSGRSTLDTAGVSTCRYIREKSRR